MKRSLVTTGAIALVLAAGVPAGAAITSQISRGTDRPALRAPATINPSTSGAAETELSSTTSAPTTREERRLPPVTESAPLTTRPAEHPATTLAPKPEPTRPEGREDVLVRLECAARVADSKAVVGCSWSEPRVDSLVGYRLWRLGADGAGRQIIARTERREFVDKDVVPGAKYVYAVEVLGRPEISLGFSNKATVEIRNTDRPEIAPIRLACIAKSLEERRGVLCEWSAVENPAVRSYQLWRTTGEGTRELVTTVAKDGARRYFDTGVAPGATVVYAVIALDGDGRKVGASEPVRVVLGDAPVPSTTLAKPTIADGATTTIRK